METEYLLVWKDYTEGSPITHHEVFQSWGTLQEFVFFIVQNDLVSGLHLMKWDGCKLVSLGTVVVQEQEVERC